MRGRAHSRRDVLRFLSSIPVFLTLPCGLVWAARVRIRALRHWPDPEKTRLVFDLDGPAQFEKRVLRDPPRLVLVVRDAELRDPSVHQSLLPGDGRLRSLEVVQSADAVEFRLELSRDAEVAVFDLPPNEAGRGYRIVLDVVPRWTASETAEREARVRAVRDSGDKIVAIDPGHGGEDPGTVYGRSLREKDVALDVARLLARQLQAQPGLRAVLTRDADYFIPLQKRQAIARQYGAQLFVSLHVNSAPSREARGAEIFFLSLQGAKDSSARELVDRENAADLVGGVPPDQVHAPLVDILVDMTRNHTMKDSERLAEVLLQSLDRVQGATVRGIKQGPLAVLKSIDKPSVLVELGFITNREDRRLLAESRAKQLYAQRLAQGIAEYLA